MACCIILSTTVGIPTRRFFPLSLGISTLRTGFGRYVRWRILSVRASLCSKVRHPLTTCSPSLPLSLTGTMTSADFSRQALRRGFEFLDLRHPFRIAIGLWLLMQSHPRANALVSSFCTSGQCFAADFLQTQCHHWHLVFGCTLAAIRPRSGLTPVRLCPCRANIKKERLEPLFFIAAFRPCVWVFRMSR